MFIYGSRFITEFDLHGFYFLCDINNLKSVRPIFASHKKSRGTHSRGRPRFADVIKISQSCVRTSKNPKATKILWRSPSL